MALPDLQRLIDAHFDLQQVRVLYYDLLLDYYNLRGEIKETEVW